MYTIQTTLHILGPGFKCNTGIVKSHLCLFTSALRGVKWCLEKIFIKMVVGWLERSLYRLNTLPLTLGTRGFFSRATRSFVGHRPKTRAGHFLRLDRNWKPRMKSLWNPGYLPLGCDKKKKKIQKEYSNIYLSLCTDPLLWFFLRGGGFCTQAISTSEVGWKVLLCCSTPRKVRRKFVCSEMHVLEFKSVVLSAWRVFCPYLEKRVPWRDSKDSLSRWSNRDLICYGTCAGQGSGWSGYSGLLEPTEITAAILQRH